MTTQSRATVYAILECRCAPLGMDDIDEGFELIREKLQRVSPMNHLYYIFYKNHPEEFRWCRHERGCALDNRKQEEES